MAALIRELTRFLILLSRRPSTYSLIAQEEEEGEIAAPNKNCLGQGNDLPLVIHVEYSWQFAEIELAEKFLHLRLTTRYAN